MQEVDFPKPLIVYVGGTIADDRNLSLGHAGAVVEGAGTRAREKMALLDAYLGVPAVRARHDLRARPAAGARPAHPGAARPARGGARALRRARTASATTATTRRCGSIRG